jgi:two-component system, NtrC family, response regulator HydG
MTSSWSSPPRTIVIGNGRRMQAVLAAVRVMGDSESTGVITGESGTGKEVTAHLIHEASRRRSGPFVAVSCAVFSDTLVESELFGHERGAFTGAIKDRAGRFELANGGTLFLDDIDDVPLSMQVKLLRVLQDRTVERLGGTRGVPVNVRVLAGTKHDLRRLVAAGRFRDDLYYRLNVLAVTLPPLRERRDDIAALTDHFLDLYFHRRGRRAPTVSPGVRDALMRYDWPGNVRELENTCERIAQTCTCDPLQLGCQAMTLLADVPVAVAESGDEAMGVPEGTTAIFLDERIRAVERSLIRWALKSSNGNRSEAAERLHIKRSTLSDRIRRCGLDTPSDAAAGTSACPPAPDVVSWRSRARRSGIAVAKAAAR